MNFIFIVTVVETAIALIIIIILLILAQLFGTKNKNVSTAEKLKSVMPVKAKAIILSMEPTQVFTSLQQQVRLQVQVLPERGRNFVAEIKELVTHAEFADFKGGTVVTVFYNPVTLKQVTLVKNISVIV